MNIVAKLCKVTPDWAYEIDTVLRIHGPLTNADIADLLGKARQRTHEIVSDLHKYGYVIKERRGREVIVKLPCHL